MNTRRKYTIGSLIVIALGIGFVVYLVRRKPTVNVTGVIELGDPIVTYKATPGVETSIVDAEETDVARMIRISNAAIAADEMDKL